MSTVNVVSAHDSSAWMQQFSGLRDRHPALWPSLPRLLLLTLFIMAVIAGGAWLLWLSQWEALEYARAEEQKLRSVFREKVIQTKNLKLLRAQKTRVMAEVAKLERQLPGKAEMDAMLSEINQAGVGRGLQFELFKPGQVQISQHYAELPIDIRLSGGYHALGGFISDIANLPRIVTIDRLTISRQKDGLAFQAVAHTYRYLDPADSDQVLARPSGTAGQKVGSR
jgi:type IV pilus assembly protein PilO